MSAARPDTWMPMYWGDYLRDTSHLSASEHGAYMLLIGHYWTTGKPLPNDDSRLSRIARMTPREWKQAKAVLAPFFQISEEIWAHKRVEKELTTATAKTEAKAEAGKLGAQKRWQNHESSDGKQDGKTMAEPSVRHRQTDAPSQPQPHSNPSPSETALSSASGSIDECDQAIAMWNEMAAKVNLPKVQKLTDARRSKLRARLRECGGIEGWAVAIDKVKNARWMHGGNDRNWKASIKFMLQEESFTSLMEGAYDRDRNGGNQGGNGESDEERRKAISHALAGELENG